MKKKKNYKRIRVEVKARLKRIADMGWKPLACDKYHIDHFLKFGADSLYKKDGEILCRNCILGDD